MPMKVEGRQTDHLISDVMDRLPENITLERVALTFCRGDGSETTQHFSVQEVDLAKFSLALLVANSVVRAFREHDRASEDT